MDLAAETEETRSVSSGGLHGGMPLQTLPKTPSKLNMQSFEGLEQVPQGAFIIPAGAVVMMPAGSQVQYMNNRALASGASEPESERTPETGEQRFAL
jgi:hypothetical protein